MEIWKCEIRDVDSDVDREGVVYVNGGVERLEAIRKVAEKVAERELDSAFAVVRSPGHHAEEDQSMGFCLFNNVGIATRYLLDQRSELGIKKILIVDWDVHHGNGTQKIFYEDRRVLFFSVHRYEAGFYPYSESEDGSHKKIGEGLGKGYNINVPWNKAKRRDDDYYAVWDHILIPVAKEFGPDLIMLSAGFDAAVGDELGKCLVTPHGFSVLLKKLMEVAEGRIVMALEGGYNTTSLAESTLACMKVLLGDNVIPSTSKKCLSKSTWKVIQLVSKELCPFWPILDENLKKTPQTSESDDECDPLPEHGLKLEVDMCSASNSVATSPSEAFLDPGLYRSMIEVLATGTDLDVAADVVSNEDDSGALAAIRNAAYKVGFKKCLEFVGKNNVLDLQIHDFEAFIESEVTD